MNQIKPNINLHLHILLGSTPCTIRVPTEIVELQRMALYEKKLA